LVALLRQAALATACPHIGLLAGRMWCLADLGAAGEVVRHSPSVCRALQSLIAHQDLNGDGGMVFLIHRGPSVDLGYAIYHPAVVRADQLYDAAISALMNFMRELCGPGWTPSDVFFPYAKPEDVGHYRTLLRVLPQFNAEFCALRFPIEHLSRAVQGADSERQRIASEQLEIQHQATELQVFRAVRRLLIEERHSGDDVAQMLSMHRRTLNRRLRARGTTFQKVLDHVRFHVARELLVSDLAMDDIAATLGYAAVNEFTRTFRRWSGTTPGRWRCEARGASNPAMRLSAESARSPGFVQ
jgi:AraC-like DNA-binding protein